MSDTGVISDRIKRTAGDGGMASVSRGSFYVVLTSEGYRSMKYPSTLGIVTLAPRTVV